MPGRRIVLLKLVPIAGAQRGGPGPAGPDTGQQGARGTAPSHTGEELTVGGSTSGEQPNADSNTRVQISASSEGRPPVHLPEPPSSKRVTRSASRTTQPSTAGYEVLVAARSLLSVRRMSLTAYLSAHGAAVALQ